MQTNTKSPATLAFFTGAQAKTEYMQGFIQAEGHQPSEIYHTKFGTNPQEIKNLFQAKVVVAKIPDLKTATDIELYLIRFILTNDHVTLEDENSVVGKYHSHIEKVYIETNSRPQAIRRFLKRQLLLDEVV